MSSYSLSLLFVPNIPVPLLFLSYFSKIELIYIMVFQLHHLENGLHQQFIDPTQWVICDAEVSASVE